MILIFWACRYWPVGAFFQPCVFFSSHATSSLIHSLFASPSLNGSTTYLNSAWFDSATTAWRLNWDKCARNEPGILCLPRGLGLGDRYSTTDALWQWFLFFTVLWACYAFVEHQTMLLLMVVRSSFNAAIASFYCTATYILIGSSTLKWVKSASDATSCTFSKCKKLSLQ